MTEPSESRMRHSRDAGLKRKMVGAFQCAELWVAEDGVGLPRWAGGRRHQPFTEPIMRPDTKCFCRNG